MPPLAERDQIRKQVKQAYLNARRAGASEKRARGLALDRGFRLLGSIADAQTFVDRAIADLEGEVV